MANNLCPQDYVDMVVSYVNKKSYTLLKRKYTRVDIYNYCINNSIELDPGDEDRIMHIINITLEPLLSSGMISENDGTYKTIVPIDRENGFVIEDYDDSHRMSFTEEEMAALWNITGALDSDYKESENPSEEHQEKPKEKTIRYVMNRREDND